MNRKMQKELTRKTILFHAKKLFLKDGFLPTKTQDIARAAKVAHGTIFLHFPTKEALMLEIINEEMNKLSNKLSDIVEENNVSTILNHYLDIVSENVLLYSTLAKEKPFYQPDLRKKLFFKETEIKRIIFDLISKEINTEPSLITTLINCFFGSLDHYLMNHDFYAEKPEELIPTIKPNLIKIFNTTITAVTQEV